MKKFILSFFRRALPSLLLIFVPISFALQLYAVNSLEFSTPLVSMIPHFIIIILLVTFFLVTILSFAPSAIRTPIIGMLYAVGVLFWVQGAVINWDYGVLTGAPIDWSVYNYRYVIDVMLWFVLFGLFVFFSDKVAKNGIYIFLFIFVIQCGTTVFALQTNLQQNDAHLYSLTHEDRMNFSKDKNVVILMLDAFQSDIFQEIVEENHEYTEVFNGFTYFRNATAQYSKTYGAIPAFLTGHWYENQETITSFLHSAFRDSISTLLKNDGWLSHLYPLSPRIIGYSEDYATNIRRKTNTKDIAEQGGLVFDLGLFRVVPQPLKKLIMNDMQWTFKNVFPDIKIHSALTYNNDTVEGSFFHPIQKFVAETEQTLRVNSKIPTFKFFHFNIPHEPFVLNESLEVERLPSNRDGFKRYSMAGLNAMKIFIKELKRNDVFNNTMIFIVGDHGGGEYNPGIKLANDMVFVQGENNIPAMHHQSGLPLVLAKPFNSDTHFSISDAPVSLGDVIFTISENLGKNYEYEGINLFSPDIENQGDRERRYLFYEFAGWNQQYLPEMTEYIIKGHSWLSSSWIPTTNTFHASLREDNKADRKLDSIVYLDVKYRPSELQNKNILANGWSNYESTLDGVEWVWSKNKILAVEFEIERSMTVELALDLRPHTCGGSFKGQKVYVKSNGINLGEWDVKASGTYTITIPNYAFNQNKIQLTMYVPDAVSPIDCQTGLDSRALGLSLTGLEVSGATIPTLSVRERIKFIEKNDLIPYVLNGWSHQEPSHRWTDGPEAQVLLQVDGDAGRDLVLRLDASGYLGGGRTYQSIGVTVNGVLLDTWQMAGRVWYEATIPADVAGDGLLDIRFSISDPTAPCDVGDSTDCRKLGIAVREIVIDYVQP